MTADDKPELLADDPLRSVRVVLEVFEKFVTDESRSDAEVGQIARNIFNAPTLQSFRERLSTRSPAPVMPDLMDGELPDLLADTAWSVLGNKGVAPDAVVDALRITLRNRAIDRSPAPVGDAEKCGECGEGNPKGERAEAHRLLDDLIDKAETGACDEGANGWPEAQAALLSAAVRCGIGKRLGAAEKERLDQAAGRSIPASCNPPLHVFTIDVPADGGEKCACGKRSIPASKGECCIEDTAHAPWQESDGNAVFLRCNKHQRREKLAEDYYNLSEPHSYVIDNVVIAHDAECIANPQRCCVRAGARVAWQMRRPEAAPKEREVAERITDANKLRLLAVWFDTHDDARGFTGDRDVQRDLRRIADELAKETT